MAFPQCLRVSLVALLYFDTMKSVSVNLDLVFPHAANDVGKSMICGSSVPMLTSGLLALEQAPNRKTKSMIYSYTLHCVKVKQPKHIQK